MLVYGRNVAKEILGKNKKVEKIILQESFDDKEINSLIEKGNFRVEVKQKRDIDRLAEGVHQGIILYIPDYKYKTLNEVLEHEPQFLVLLDHLEDPHNLGAIIRTSEAAGVDAIIMPKDRQVMINSTVMKTSVGTLDNMDIVAVTNLVQTIEELKKNGYWASDFARTGILEGNPIHRDMIYAARKAKLAFICNVVINAKKEIVGAFAGDCEQAHLAGAQFLKGLCQCQKMPADIVITTNNGHPLDQNIYQAVKGMTVRISLLHDHELLLQHHKQY